MKTFDDEYRELIEWLEERLEESYKLPNDTTGLDGGQQYVQQRADDIEYRRRLRELEAKHGITVDELVSHEKMKRETA